MEGSSNCSGLLQVKQRGLWTVVNNRNWDLKLADIVCRRLDCGSVLEISSRINFGSYSLWTIPSCLGSGSTLRKCFTKRSLIHETNLEIICSESVRLVNGTSLCSGRLEVKSNQSWSSVCEDDFDLQDAEVVCRELGCGTPSVVQGSLYEQMAAPVWTNKFQCEGHESALLDCASSGSVRDTCLSGKAVKLTCSEPDSVWLVGGSSHCNGELEVKQQRQWGKVGEEFQGWNVKTADFVCRQLNCGSAISTGQRQRSYGHGHNVPFWSIGSTCLHSGSTVRECILSRSVSSVFNLEANCSESIRLVNGTSLCSGRLEVKSNQSWSSVCEDDFDLQDAEVVCRELGCGAPSVLKGALYGEVEAPVWTKEFQCEGHESALLDCKSSGSVSNTCSRGKAVGLTCSEPDNVRLLGGGSCCDGVLEMRQHGEWRSVIDGQYKQEQKLISVSVCTQLDCGSAVSTERRDSFPFKPYWSIDNTCVQHDSTLRKCLLLHRDPKTSTRQEVICSDFLAQPNISFSTYIDGVSEVKQQGLRVLMGSNFTMSCSILPQYQGGSFQLILTTLVISQSYTQPAVNHSAHFLFSAADHTHQGDYRCVYHIYVFSQNFSSESQLLYLTVSASVTNLIIRLVVLVLMVVFSAALFFYYKATRGQTPRQEDNVELDYLGGAEEWQGEEAEDQGTSRISKAHILMDISVNSLM